ncbi:MAG: hypothetical protein ACOYN4_17650 [Bacteroidales bacterium]
MKKLFLIAIFAFTVINFVGAQEIGVRLGGTNGAGGAAIDGVFESSLGRIHADLGFYNGGVGVDALLDFINKPLSGEEFSWYLGAGPTTYIGDVFWLGVCGEIGLEYKFNTVPIVIGADWRPTLWIIETTDFGANSFGLNVRYRFGK